MTAIWLLYLTVSFGGQPTALYKFPATYSTQAQCLSQAALCQGSNVCTDESLSIAASDNATLDAYCVRGYETDHFVATPTK